MALKYKITKEDFDSLDEKIRAEYKADGEGYVCNIVGVGDPTKLGEFRENNLRLERELRDAKGAAESAIKKLEDYEATKGKAESTKLREMEEAHKKALADKDAEVSKARDQMERDRIDKVVTESAVKAGIRPEALPDILYRSREAVKMDEGKVTVFDGEKRIYDANGEPMAIDGWLKGLTAKAPHLFAASNGSGAQGGSKGGRHEGPNPFKRGETFNLTEQSRLVKHNPEEANRLKTEAGV